MASVAILFSATSGISAANSATGLRTLNLPSFAFENAVDGSDLFWVNAVASRHDHSFSLVVERTSLIDFKTMPIYVLDDPAVASEFIDRIDAGGGWVAIRLTEAENFNSDVKTSVTRFKRDGSSPQTIASGQLLNPSVSAQLRASRRRELIDCGTKVTVADVSDTGEVVVAASQRERKGKLCSGKRNSNTWRYTGFLPDGTSRYLFSVDTKIHFTRVLRRQGKGLYTRESGDSDHGLREVVARGDHMLIQHFLRTNVLPFSFAQENLTTGVISIYNVDWTGPAKIGDAAGSDNVSMDSQGRIALGFDHFAEARVGHKRKTIYEDGLSVFPVAGDPTSRVTARLGRGFSLTQFCGDKLVALTAVPHNENAVDLRVLDPATGNVLRDIGSFRFTEFYEDAFCDENFLLFPVGSTDITAGGRVKFRVVPLE